MNISREDIIQGIYDILRQIDTSTTKIEKIQNFLYSVEECMLAEKEEEKNNA